MDEKAKKAEYNANYAKTVNGKMARDAATKKYKQTLRGKQMSNKAGNKIRNKNKLLKNTIKSYYGCTNPNCYWCGPFSPSQLHFHHIDSLLKDDNIAKNNKSATWIISEANKCCVLCANCHAQEVIGELDASSFRRCKINENGEPTKD